MVVWNNVGHSLVLTGERGSQGELTSDYRDEGWVRGKFFNRKIRIKMGIKLIDKIGICWKWVILKTHKCIMIIYCWKSNVLSLCRRKNVQ